jgi:CHAT domain-containing protein
MVAPLPLLGALLALQGPAPTHSRALGPGVSEDPARVVWIATRAVEGDSTEVVRARWLSRLRRDPADRAVLLGLATLARLTYDYAQAAHRYARLLASPGASPDRYAVHARLGQALALRVRWKTEQADRWLQLADSEARLTGDSAASAEALFELAYLRARAAGVASAESLFARGESMLARGDRRLQAMRQCTRARVRAVVASPLTEELAITGARQARAAGEPRLEAACLHALAGDLRRRGLLDSALTVWERVEALQRDAGDRAGLAATLQWRGAAWSQDGYYGYARRDLEDAVREGHASGNLSAVAWAWMNLTWIAQTTGDLASSREYAGRAERLLTAQGDQWGLAGLRSHQGDLATGLGDPAGARTAYRDALERWSRFGQMPAGVITVRTQLARLALAEGDLAGAEVELGHARRVARERRLPTWETGLATVVGVLALRRGDLAAAEREFRRGLASDEPDQHVFRYRNRARLAEVYARRGQLDRAEAELAAAGDELDAWRATLDDRRLRVHAFEYEEDRLDPDLGFATVIAALAEGGRAASAFRLAEQRRARELLDALARGAAIRLTPLPGRDVSASRARTGAPRPHRGTGAPEVMAALPDSTALLEYVTGRGGEPTTLFVVTRHTLRAVLLPAVDSLGSTIARLVTLLETGGEASAPARHLGAALLGPALAVLPRDAKRLIVVPDDILHRVSFDALVLPDGRMAIQRFAVSLAPSAGVLLELWHRPARGGDHGLLAFGDPAFPDPAPAAGDTALARLPASAREARLAARFADGATVRLRSDASEAYLRSARLTDYSVLHFATHAVVDERSVVRTRLALAPGDGEDGSLGPGDLAALQLDADLVVLSACRTAGGVVVRGEGVQGLVAPLIEAGARSVVATQWRVPDRAAARFVESFYRALGRGLTVVDALRAAKVEALRRGARAGEWAAFTAVGDPLVRPFARQAGTGRRVTAPAARPGSSETTWNVATASGRTQPVASAAHPHP